MAHFGVAVDESGRLPLVVRQRLAMEVKDPATEVGQALYSEIPEQVQAAVQADPNIAQKAADAAAQISAAGVLDPYAKTADADAKYATPTALTSAVATVAPAAARAKNVNSFMVIGDSITIYGGGKSTATPTQGGDGNFDSKGIWTWANIMLGMDLEFMGNSGIGGQTSLQIRNRFDTDVLAYAPGIVGILAGANDTTDVNTIANLTSMYERARAAGILVVAATIPPNQNFTSDRDTHAMRTNDWIRRYALTTPGIVLADIAAAMQDAGQTGFKPLSGYLHDGVHPSIAGAQAGGKIIADALRPFVARNRHRSTVPVAPFNILGNPHFLGTVTDVNSTTKTLGAWGISGSGLTVTTLDRTDGIAGRMLEIVVPAGGFVNLSNNVSVGSALAVGDECELGIEVEIVSRTENGQFAATLAQYNGSSFNNHARAAAADGSAPYGKGLILPGQHFGFRTPKRAVASGTTLIQAQIGMNGAGTYRLKGAYIRDLTKILALG